MGAPEVEFRVREREFMSKMDQESYAEEVRARRGGRCGCRPGLVVLCDGRRRTHTPTHCISISQLGARLVPHPSHSVEVEVLVGCGMRRVLICVKHVGCFGIASWHKSAILFLSLPHCAHPIGGLIRLSSSCPTRVAGSRRVPPCPCWARRRLVVRSYICGARFCFASPVLRVHQVGKRRIGWNNSEYMATGHSDHVGWGEAPAVGRATSGVACMREA